MLSRCYGVEPPVVGAKARVIVTPEQFDAVYAALEQEIGRRSVS
jgi:hypothetical protein